MDLDSLVPDDSISIDEGAVAPWNSLMWSLMTDVCREMGVRTDIPFKDLTDEEKDIVYHGPAEKKHIFYKAKKSNQAGELDFTYYNAVYTVENALAKVKDEKGMKRVEKFLKEEVCPECGGSRLSEAARAPKLCGIGLAEACKMTLKELVEWVAHVPESLPKEMRPMAESICESFQTVAKRLMDLGLSYLSLDRAAATLVDRGAAADAACAGGAKPHDRRVVRAWMSLRSVCTRPISMGLNAVMHDLIADGNSVLLVDHDTQILSEADWLDGDGTGSRSGRWICDRRGHDSQRLPIKSGFHDWTISAKTTDLQYPEQTHLKGNVCSWKTSIFPPMRIHTVKPLEVDIPKGQAYRGDRCVRFREDHDGSGKPDSGTGGAAERRDICRNM